jgi:hypothetical protein
MGEASDTGPTVVYSELTKPNTVYLGPRKLDDPPQATFNYGDGKYVIKFLYKKDGKVGERAASTGESEYPEDKKDVLKMKYATGNREPSIDGGGSIVTGD